MSTGFTAALLAVILLAAQPISTDPADLAVVNGVRISERDVKVFAALRGLPPSLEPKLQRQIVEELVERELIRQFLDSRKVELTEDQKSAALLAASARVTATGRDPHQSLQDLMVEPAELEREVLLAARWQRHLQQVLTEGQIRDHFEANRRRFDGTQLRVSQIFLQRNDGENDAALALRLQKLRDRIASGESFAEVARAASASPSSSAGGDVGWIGPIGGLPRNVSLAAFALPPGEVSPPVISPLGGHLVTVTEVRPGDISLEDARPDVVAELSRKFWDETVATQR